MVMILEAGGESRCTAVSLSHRRVGLNVVDGCSAKVPVS